MVFCLGESLLDIIISSPDDVVVRPGGAMLNAAISIGRCNIKVTLISELGDDDSADMILTYLQKNNVEASFIKCYKNSKTSLALAFLDENKKPKYSFIKKNLLKILLRTLALGMCLMTIGSYADHTDLMTLELTNYMTQLQQEVITIANEQSTSSSQIIPVDINTGFTDSLLADDVHCNESGANFICTKIL